MPDKLPQITSLQLIRLLKKDGWVEHRQSKHGLSMVKHLSNGKTLVTTIPRKRGSIPDGTLNTILGRKQTKIGKEGLRKLLQK